ncbi:hypothetical protein AVEN_199579-1 [Araneus ventricosus]|uniref:Uncharacterized protein n=1 Tax=Araneus ventricosus TaxID=182803 RepID=A0A4Y2V0P7_ARAVE|nr:hypothetical protein AVEN_199579-1 [Araneus ventricosus]
MKIGSLDVKETRRLREREQRCIDPESRSCNCPEERPKSKYIGHITVSNGEAITIAKGIIEFLKQNEQGLSNLTVTGCDGTNVNMGVNREVIRHLEMKCGRPLQWIVCLLHANELPLRHLLQTLDGVTSGLRAFSGQIGIAIKTYEELAIVPFEAIEGTSLPEMDEFHIRDLSDDQRYLKDMFQAVSDANCPNDLANRKPGPVVYSRWLTTASRILRLYVSTKNPSNDYIDLIDWNEPKRKRYELPLTEMITGTEIETIAKTGKAPDTQLFKVLCHSQGTKRCVRLVTEASGK